MDDALISADTHVVEPPYLWESLGSHDWVPHVRDVDGADWWFVGDEQVWSFSADQAGVRFEGQERIKVTGKGSDMRPGSYDPVEHLKDNEQDGVMASVIYPTVALLFYRTPHSEHFDAICTTYNDWIAKFCSVNPERLKGAAMLNVDDPDRAAAELTRAKEMGLAGALISVGPRQPSGYADPGMDVLWETAAKLSMPLGMHIGSERMKFEGPSRVQRAGLTLAVADYWVRKSIAEMILSGVFDRFPDLRIISVEHEAGWLPFFLDNLDYNYTQKALKHRLANLEKDLPSHYYHSNISTSITEDRLLLMVKNTVGVDTLMWGSDYPHIESSFPRSRKILREILAGLSEAEVRAVTHDNAAALFNITV